MAKKFRFTFCYEFGGVTTVEANTPKEAEEKVDEGINEKSTDTFTWECVHRDYFTNSDVEEISQEE
jgi:hypothetical protein